MSKKAIIIGAGPAGLTAAYELLKRTDIVPIVLEKTGDIGGISCTAEFKGNRMDMGPHRFFSKSDRVMDWWLHLLPLQEEAGKSATISYQNKSRDVGPSQNPAAGTGNGMLLIRRLTRIYFLRKFFAYPIQLSLDTLKTLGFIRTLKIMLSFLWIRLFPRKPEKSLEDFIINKFGRELYVLFFKDYTEKVWGIAPSQISAEWGAQRIKGVSLSKAIGSAVCSLKAKRKGVNDIGQKATETSLIEQFLYPKYGPGSLWEEVARQVREMGGRIIMNQEVVQIASEEGQIVSITTRNGQTGEIDVWEGDYFFSSMPVQQLVAGFVPHPPADVREVAEGLQYRDFINVGILLKQLATQAGEKLDLKDNWIYIQEKDVKVGRLMIYNNWGGGMVADPNTVWIGMEYFCNKTDSLWAMDDEAIRALAVRELVQMDLARPEDILDGTVRRMEKTYPAYFGTYERFDTIKSYVNTFENLFLVGRNGMHKYNNADHSMLCAMVAVDNIVAGVTKKENIWSINTEQEYHEEKQTADQKVKGSAPTDIRRQAPSLSLSFREFLLGTPTNRMYLFIAALAFLLQIVIFKYFYPMAGFINGDSYVYLRSAYLNDSISTHPIGYPNFLRLFSVFTKSDTALVAFQYLLLQASSLIFVFTVFYFHKVGRLTKNLIYGFVCLNPINLYVANYVSSDALFISLSIIWFTLLIWLILKPSISLVVLQVLVVSYAFTVRYNALYYPVISALAILLSRKQWIYKVITIASSFTLIALFMWNTSQKFYEATGTRQFTPFSGWQLANNALNGYFYTDSATRKPVPAKFRELDAITRNFIDTTRRNIFSHTDMLLFATTYYMWERESPLVQYAASKGNVTPPKIPLRPWSSVAPLYRDYGTFLIRQYPTEYLRYYLFPNVAKFYAPPLEVLENYNMGRDTVAAIAIQWFGYPSNKVKTRLKDLSVPAVKLHPMLTACFNVLFAISFIFLLMLKRYVQNRSFLKILWVAAGFWLANFAFSVVSAPVYLRYQLFPALVFFVFASVMIEFIYQVAFTPSKIQKSVFTTPEVAGISN